MKKVVLAALFAISSPVFAQGYVGIGFGEASVDIEPSDIAGYSADESDTSFKVFGGMIINKNFAVEVAYQDFGEASERIDQGPSFAQANYEASAFSVAALGILPVSPQAGLFAKVGFARWELDATASNSLGTRLSESETGFDPLFGFGGQLQINNFFLRAEFERFTDVGEDNTTGQSDIDVIGLSAAVKF